MHVILTGSQKYFGKYLDSLASSQLGEDADIVCFFTLSKTIQRHSPSKFHLKAPRLIFKASSKNALLFFFLLQIFLKSVWLLFCSFKFVQIYKFQSSYYIDLAALKLNKLDLIPKENLQAFQIQFQGKLSFFKAVKIDLKLVECMVFSLESKNLYLLI